MSFAIIIIFTCLVLFVLGVMAMLTNLDVKHPTKALPPVKPKKTIEEMLKTALASPPIGCMWEVKRVVKHFRKLPSGRMVFDGTVENIFAEVRFITPYGEIQPFSLNINDADFEQELNFNVKAVLKQYEKQLEGKSSNKAIEGGWDGIYH